MIKKPKILVFDEATSALDMITETNIQKSIQENIIDKGGLTVIQIAHRLSTIKKADIIFMLNKGEIVEKGNYEDLMAKKGEFFELVEIQTKEEVKKKKKKDHKEVKVDDLEELDLKAIDTLISRHSKKVSIRKKSF